MCNPQTIAASLPPEEGKSGSQDPAGPAERPAPRVTLPTGSVRDLTHVVGPDWPVFDLYVKPMEIRRLANLAEHEYNALELTYNEHIGTHIDAPLHFDDDGLSVERIPADSLVAPLAVVRIGDRAARDHVTELTVDDLVRWESRHGRIPDRALLAVDNGWAARINTPGAFLNFDEKDGLYRFPGISVEAAAFLVEERSVVGVGTDSPSLDPGSRPADPYTHRVILPAGRYGVECLAGLDTVPDVGAVAVVGAPRHAGGTGGPARVLAFL
ncbi:cyclase family protein [Streptomyces rubiginosohelvolus]|uniref:cyclase family protein n=1 Tax=Streptomyces rubiginosohelvolus TaxID=67362 RepID=UPI0036782A7E